MMTKPFASLSMLACRLCVRVALALMAACLMILGTAVRVSAQGTPAVAVNGGVTAQSVNGVVMADQQSGANACAKVQTAIDSVIAAGGGTVDARGILGTQSCGTTTISVGNTSLVPVTLILPPSGSWRWNGNIGSTCAVSLFGKSAIIGTGSGEGNPFTFEGTSGFSGNSVFCTSSVSGLDYYRAQGFSVVLDSGATANTAVTNTTGMADDAKIESVHTVVRPGATAAKGLWVTRSCCGASLINVGTDTENNTGTTPATFGDGVNNIVDVNVFSPSFVHPGPGLPALFVTGGAFVGTLNFYGLFTETGTSYDTTTALFQIDANVRTASNFFGGRCDMQMSSATNFCFDVAAGSRINVYGFSTTGVTADANAINDHNRGITILADANGNTYDYSSFKSPEFIAIGGGPSSNSFSNAMLALFPDASHRGLTVSNQADAFLNAIDIDSGLTAAQGVQIRFLDRGTASWGLERTSSSFRLVDIKDSNFPSFEWDQQSTSGVVFINSQGSAPVKINATPNASTSGQSIYGGGASPVDQLDLTGKGGIISSRLLKKLYFALNFVSC